MKQNRQLGIIVLVIVMGVIVGISLQGDKITSQNTSQVTSISYDPYKELRSNGKHTDEEKRIKDTVDKYMFENFGSIFKTTWYDSVSASGAVINDYGKFFIVQSSGEEEKAKKFVGGVLTFFNSRTTTEEYRVDKVFLLNKNGEVIYQVDTIIW